MTTTLTSVQTRLVDALERVGPVMVPLDTIQRLFTEVRPRTSEHADRRRELHDDLHALAVADRVRLPRSVSSWDRLALPPLPQFVTVRPAMQPPPAIARVAAHKVGWRPELRWAARERDWSQRRMADLIAINRFLSTSGTRPIVPLRERSVQLFGDEKRLGALLDDPRLFGEGRLTLDLLRTSRTSPPFIRRCRNRSLRDALIVENWDTFETLATYGPDVGILLYGAGAHVTAALSSLRDDPPAALWYFGDLDLAGLTIARRAEQTAISLGIGPVRPATGLYRLLLEHGIPQPIDKKSPSAAAVEREIIWLADDDLANACRVILLSGRRIAQEQLGAELLLSTPSVSVTD